jgi:hypothetical protein
MVLLAAFFSFFSGDYAVTGAVQSAVTNKNFIWKGALFMNFRKMAAGVALLLAALLIWPAAVHPSAETRPASSALIDPDREVSLTIVKIRNSSGAVPNGLQGGAAEGTGVSGSLFLALKIADRQLLFDESGGGLYYVPNAHGKELLRLCEAQGIRQLPYAAGGSAGYTAGQMEEFVNRFCAAGGGEEALTSFAEQAQDVVHFLPTGPDGKSEQRGLAQGLYLIAQAGEQKETAARKEADGQTEIAGEHALAGVRPFLVSLPESTGLGAEGDAWQYDVTVFPKQQNISVPKYIVSCEDHDRLLEREDVELGERFEQVIFPALPKAEPWHAYESYVVRDEMDAGMRLCQIKAVRFGRKVEAAEKLRDFEAFTDWKEGVEYEIRDLAGGRDPVGTNGFAVTLLQAGLEQLNKEEADAQLEILFETKLDEKAGDGGGEILEDRPSVDWKVRGEQEGHLDGNQPGVCSYRLRMTKTGLQDPSQAAFGVERKRDGSSCRFIREGEGRWRMAGKDEEPEGSEKYVNPSGDGTLVIRGLDAGSYRFTEVMTQKGTELLQNPFDVILHADTPVDGCLSEAAVCSGNGEEIPVAVEKGTVSFTVRNRRSLFPKTGGAGRWGFYAAGAAVIAVLARAAGRRRRRYEV